MPEYWFAASPLYWGMIWHFIPGGGRWASSLQRCPVTRPVPPAKPLVRGAGGLEGVSRYCAAPAAPVVAAPRHLPPLSPPLTAPQNPGKSTELSRSDGRSQNSIWCALFVDCVRLVAEGTRRGAYHAEMGRGPPPPPPNTQQPCQITRDARACSLSEALLTVTQRRADTVGALQLRSRQPGHFLLKSELLFFVNGKWAYQMLKIYIS